MFFLQEKARESEAMWSTVRCRDKASVPFLGLFVRTNVAVRPCNIVGLRLFIETSFSRFANIRMF